MREILFVASASDFTEADLPDPLKLQVGLADRAVCWSAPQVRSASGWRLP